MSIKDGAEKNDILFQGKTRTKNGMKGLTLFFMFKFTNTCSSVVAVNWFVFHWVEHLHNLLFELGTQCQQGLE